MLECKKCGFKYPQLLRNENKKVRSCVMCSPKRIRKHKQRLLLEKMKKTRIKTFRTVNISGFSVLKNHILNLIKRVCETRQSDIKELDLEQEFNYDNELDYWENKSRIIEMLKERGLLDTETEIELELKDVQSDMEKFKQEEKEYLKNGE